MEKPFDFKVAVEFAMARNDELTKRYRESVRSVRTPSVNKVIQSVIDQKIKHADILRSIAESDASVQTPPVGMAQSLVGPIAHLKEEDPAIDLLNLVLTEETRLAALYACLRDASKDEENHQKLRALSEASLKFSGWVKDHLELLELF
jgi:hypothetical protein